MARGTGFGYDSVGNRVTRDVVSPTLTATESYAYDVFSNRLLSTAASSGGVPIQTRTLAHSDSGNRSADTAVGAVANVAYTMAYDATDRLTGVSNAGIPLGAYLHNALGQRVSKTVGVTTTHYLYDLSGTLIAEADGVTGAVTAEYIAFEGMTLAFITTGGIYWIHADHLGAPQVLTDGTGAQAWSALYSPFGLAEVTGTLTYNPRFPGQYKDEETALHYNYHRTYDPTSGRYVESDPIGLRGGWNTYGYVGGNPVGRVDPRGLLYCSYGISSQFLLCKNNSGEIEILFGDDNVHSGRNEEDWRCRNNQTCRYIEDFGPTPPGRYNIVPPPCSKTSKSWICIIPAGGTEIYKREKFTFRIHTGNVSWGCITISKKNQDVFDTIARWAVEDGGGTLNVNP